MVLSMAHGSAARGFFLAMPRDGEKGFEPARVEGARGFLALLGPALANALYVGELREAAVRDDLARCYNRRHFESFLEEEVARARRFRSRVSVVFLDMDDLKSVNTLHGHAMGSRSLQEVADRVTAGIRSIDKLFRFGGDEFCMVLPQTDTRGATEVAERVRQAIASEPILVEETGGVRMSASLGVATFPDHAGQPGDLVQAADRAMQEAKRRGKNSVAFAAAVPLRGPGDGAGREEGA